MVIRAVNSLLAVLTRPYIFIQKYMVVVLQSYLPSHFDETSWYFLYAFITIVAFIFAFVLSRYVTLQDADDDPIYQRARFYSMQRKHRKIT